MHWLSECDTTALYKPCEEGKKEIYSLVKKILNDSYRLSIQGAWLLFFPYTFSFPFITDLTSATIF
jgi:hypothetical protein